MGKSDRRAILSILTRLLEYLLKLSYWDAAKDHSGNHWAAEIVNFRAQIQHRLEDSSSLRSDSFDGVIPYFRLYWWDGLCHWYYS